MTFNLRKIVSIISLITSLSAVNGQEFDLGFKAGLCLPGFSLVKNINQNSTLSAQGSSNLSYGVNMIVKIKGDHKWEIWLEPGFIKKGGMVKYTYHNPSVSIPIDSYCGVLYSDVEMPIIVNCNLIKKLDCCVGLGLGYTVSSEHLNSALINAPGRNLLPDLDNKLNSSIITGLNYNLNKYYALTLRYTLGLTKVVTADLVAESNYHFTYTAVQTSVYNNSLQLSLIYSCNL